jgi:hypothetical protein
VHGRSCRIVSKSCRIVSNRVEIMSNRVEPCRLVRVAIV